MLSPGTKPETSEVIDSLKSVQLPVGQEFNQALDLLVFAMLLFVFLFVISWKFVARNKPETAEHDVSHKYLETLLAKCILTRTS